MSIVELLPDDQYAALIKDLDQRVRQYTQAPMMTNYVKAAAYQPSFLAQMAEEHLAIMPTRKLPRQIKEMIAVAVSMTNGCDYCIRAHTRVLKTMFRISDAVIVELAAATAHINGLVAFERSMLIGVDGVHGPFPPLDVAAEPLLGEIEQTLGVVPLYYRVLAQRPAYLAIVWRREQVTMLDGSLDRRTKRFLALAVAATRGAAYSTQLHIELLRRHDVSDDELFEAIMVIEIFNKNNAFTQGLLLTPGVWQPEAGKTTAS